jgi:hypothetical protein
MRLIIMKKIPDITGWGDDMKFRAILRQLFEVEAVDEKAARYLIMRTIARFANMSSGPVKEGNSWTALPGEATIEELVEIGQKAAPFEEIVQGVPMDDLELF